MHGVGIADFKRSVVRVEIIAGNLRKRVGSRPQPACKGLVAVIYRAVVGVNLARQPPLNIVMPLGFVAVAVCKFSQGAACAPFVLGLPAQGVDL